MAKLGLYPRSINVGIDKIDVFFLTIYGIIVSGFSLQDSQRKGSFFKKAFLLADTGMKMLLRMSFLVLGNAEVQLQTESLT